MKKAGAQVETTHDGLCEITLIEYHRTGTGFHTQDTYNRWAVLQDGNPLSNAVCAPPANVVAPVNILGVGVGVEAYIILSAYQY